MPKVNIEEIVIHLDLQFKSALAGTVKKMVPDKEVDRNELYREFRKEVYRNMSGWQNVPASSVQRDDF